MTSPRDTPNSRQSSPEIPVNLPCISTAAAVALAEHKIRIQYSPSAQRYVFYPRVLAPGTLAIAQWDEGPRFATAIVNTDPSQLRVGMPIRPVFVDVPDDGITLLCYEAA